MDYLDQLSSEGQFDSSGQFTLNFASSRSRFANLANADTTAFVRLAIQSALASQARQVDIRLSQKVCQVQGVESWTAEHLQHLFDYLAGREDSYLNPTLQLAKMSCILSSCRSDLQLRVQVAGESRALELDGQGPRWTTIVAPETGGFCFTRVGERPPENRARLQDIQLFSPLLSSAWPELSQLRGQFVDPPAALLLNGISFSSDTFEPIGVDGRAGESSDNPEFFRIAFLHSDPARNNVRVIRPSRSKLLSLFAPQIFLCCDLQGRRLEVPSGARLRAHAGFSFSSHPVTAENSHPDHRVRLIKYGVGLCDTQALLPKRVRGIVDASDLATDLAGAQFVRDEAFRQRLDDAVALFQKAAALWQQRLDQINGWDKFLYRRHRLLLDILPSEMVGLGHKTLPGEPS